jgi:hypothetical protein
MPNAAQTKELLLQSLEHEKGGVQVYQTALECVRNKDLKKEWTKYFEQTRNHVKVLTEVCVALGLDPNETTPGRQIVKHNGAGLVKAMKMALAAGNAAPPSRRIAAPDGADGSEQRPERIRLAIGFAARQSAGQFLLGFFGTVGVVRTIRFVRTIGFLGTARCGRKVGRPANPAVA